MQISNMLQSESFYFTDAKPNMLVRSDEIRSLVDIEEYCKMIQESIDYEDDIWDVEVEENIFLYDWMFGKTGYGNSEDRRFLMELISKRSIKVKEEAHQISISLGVYKDCVCEVESYVEERRKILKAIHNPSEFAKFMPSCFVNSIFADDITCEMRNIKDFAIHTEEITNNLSVLNDEAVCLYKEHHNNLKAAMDILSSKLRACTPDPKHEKVLKFSFSYEECIDGENLARNKEITCSPHLKLIHKGSNLRIYFWWCDTEIGKGEKVLIGRIGRHPY